MNIETARQNLSTKAVGELTQALLAVGREGTLSDLQAVMAHVKHADQHVRDAAIQATTTLILSNLITHFNDLEPAMRQKLGIIMESLDPLIIDEIGKELYSEDENRRLRAVQVLGLLKKNPSVRTVLAKLVQDRDVKIRATAINLMGKFVDPRDHDVILSLVNDPDKRVRANTIEALEGLGNKRVVPILLRLRKDPNNRIRGNVLKALYNLGFTEISEDLMEMLKSHDNFMRASSLWVVSQIKLVTREIEDQAGYFLLSDDEMVFRNAEKALTALNTPRSQGYIRYLMDQSEARNKTAQNPAAATVAGK